MTRVAPGAHSADVLGPCSGRVGDDATCGRLGRESRSPANSVIRERVKDGSRISDKVKPKVLPAAFVTAYVSLINTYK